MPFKSRAQERAAFGGYLGAEMKAKAQQWADETPSQKALPDHVAKKKSVKLRVKKKPKNDNDMS
jgi:hypothetical protein